MKTVQQALLVLTALIFLGCATGPTVTRTAADTTIDLSGRWNDTDSRLTAEVMVESMMSGAWLERFNQDEGRDPVVIIGTVRNRSSEHIDAKTFTRNIERELVNSGRVIFVADAKAREEIREEREDQQSNATLESAAALAAETGADFMMQGTILSQTDAIEGKRATLYTVDMELIDLENNRKVWIDTKEIKKLVERKKASW
ncbi:MAG: penicillin-binding protein activator LpoB [Spirochaetales bacterium]|nr:penicillin-binding protein activator LpoB [Spirochaetales bacterium]